jgi:microcin C transport system permease protein
MLAYIVRRLLLIVPTLLAIMLINFVVIQAAPGGPVEQLISQITGEGTPAIERVTRSGGGDFTGAEPGVQASAKGQAVSSKYRGAQGLDPEFIAEIERMYGFDKPAHERFLQMIGNYIVFDFGESFFRDRDVVDLVIEKMPVSISLGIWTTLLVYLISIPLGIRKAVKDGTAFDTTTSGVIIAAYALPGFLVPVVLLVLFAGGSYWDLFPLRGLYSEGWEQMSLGSKIVDYFWHIALPVTAYTISGFATLTLLTKNSFLDEIRKQYVLTARAKGLGQTRVLYGHVFRNAMLIVIAGFPAAFVSVFFAGSIFVETVFSLDGLGLLGFESVVTRDYPVVLGTLFIFGLMGLVIKLISDLVYVWIDPRIDFERREG